MVILANYVSPVVVLMFYDYTVVYLLIILGMPY